jgi:hypothetical protein
MACPSTDTNEIKQLINRVKRGELDQGDAQLIEKLPNFLLMIVSLLERKHASIRRMKELLFGMKVSLRRRGGASDFLAIPWRRKDTFNHGHGVSAHLGGAGQAPVGQGGVLDKGFECGPFQEEDHFGRRFHSVRMARSQA